MTETDFISFFDYLPLPFFVPDAGTFLGAGIDVADTAIVQVGIAGEGVNLAHADNPTVLSLHLNHCGLAVFASHFITSFFPICI